MIPKDANIQCHKWIFTRTESGKSWRSKPDTVEVSRMTREQYEKCTSSDTVKFFRRVGGSERVTHGYTPYGYLPIQISSISPDKTIKHVRCFTFDGEAV